jgi:putative cell wall-binding protein
VERAFTSTGSGTVRAAYLEGYIWLESHTNGGTYAYTQGDSIHVEVYAEDLDDYGYYLPVIGVWDRYTDEFVDLYTPENYVYYFDTVYADIDTSGLEVSSGRYEVVAFLWDDVYEYIEDAESFYLNVESPGGGLTDFVSLAGTNRYTTAIAASQDTFGYADVVVIATGENFADALGGAALAGAVNGPLLLTRRAALPSEVAAEIARLGASKAYVLGSTAAVSSAVQTTLQTLGLAVVRLQGRTRYETAYAIAGETIGLLGDLYGGGVFVATGSNFPDALGASPIAAAFGMPIVLANPASSSIVLPAGVDHAVICGGSNVVSGAIAADLDFKLGAENTERLAGANRYGTAAAVASYGVDLGLGWDGVGIATGTNFPDALSAGPVLGAKGTVLLLVGTTLPSEIAAVLSANRDQIYTVHFFGSTAAVPQSVRNAVRSRLN